MERNLGTVRDLLTQADGPPLDDMGALGGKARGAAALLAQDAGDTIGSIMSTVHANMEWLDSQAMRQTLATSDFSLLDLNKGNTTIYVVLPPEYLPVQARLLRLFMNQVVPAAMKGRKRKHPTLIIGDETYVTGPLAIMQKSAAIIRGYGVRIWWFVQNINQLVEMYPRNWQTFFACSGLIQMFSLNDKFDWEYLSQMIGKTRAWVKRKTRDERGRVVGTEYEPAGSFPVRDPNEIARTLSRDGGLQVVLREGWDPFLLRRVEYDKHFPRSMYAPDPFEPHARSWLGEAWSLIRRARMKIMGWLG
jgi:type IV secretory pathway TraG/TraD family ATPase VirD4